MGAPTAKRFAPTICAFLVHQLRREATACIKTIKDYSCACRMYDMLGILQYCRPVKLSSSEEGRVRQRLKGLHQHIMPS